VVFTIAVPPPALRSGSGSPPALRSGSGSSCVQPSKRIDEVVQRQYGISWAVSVSVQTADRRFAPWTECPRRPPYGASASPWQRWCRCSWEAKFESGFSMRYLLFSRMRLLKFGLLVSQNTTLPFHTLFSYHNAQKVMGIGTVRALRGSGKHPRPRGVTCRPPPHQGAVHNPN
jgi:hypothetical protein